jgi:hypothetical protein
MIQTMATDVGSGLHGPASYETLRGSTAMATAHLNGFKSDASERPHQYRVVDGTQYQYMVSTYSRSWLFRWKVGTLRVEVHTTRRRVSGSPTGSIHTELHAWFRPNQSLVQLPGLAVTYSYGPDQRGFYHVAPTYVLFPSSHMTIP